MAKEKLLAEEPKEAELRRIIDIEFKSSFTTNFSQVNNTTTFAADIQYKSEEWQSKHKYALMKILMGKHKEYTLNNNILKIPKTISDRTSNYLHLSCNIISWFKENYELTDDENNTLKIKDIYDFFIRSHHFEHMTKKEKLTYNKSFFVDYITTNRFFNDYFCARHNNIRNIIKYWKRKEIYECELFLDNL